MENFNQIESDILNKLENAKDRNMLDLVKTEIFGKKGILTELFKKIGGLDKDQKKEYELSAKTLSLVRGFFELILIFFKNGLYWHLYLKWFCNNLLFLK